MKAAIFALYLLSADTADYDGEKISFKGNFHIEHPMGKLFGEKAVLVHPSLKKSGKEGSQLYLEEKVSIKVERKTPFTLYSKRAFCELPPYTLFSLFQFQEFQFFEEVEIQTAYGFSAKGGSALYKIGTLTLYPSPPASYATLFYGQERLDAKTIRFDLLQETLSCEEAKGSFPYPFSAKKLFWEKREGKLLLEEEVTLAKEGEFSLFADQAELFLSQEYKPLFFELKGSVQLISFHFQGKKSFAVADQFRYMPLENQAVLTANSPKRVLFWQEGFSMSAPEVVLSLEPESIMGNGDVHFSFDIEEKHAIEQIFSKYL